MAQIIQPDHMQIDAAVAYYDNNRDAVFSEIKNAIFIGIRKDYTEKHMVDDMIRRNHTQVLWLEIWRPNCTRCQEAARPSIILNDDMVNIGDRFADNAVDAVVAIQVLEHVSLNQALELLEVFKRVARKLVMIETPYGERSQGPADGNKYEAHQCSFYPDTFIEAGYEAHTVTEKKNPHLDDPCRRRILALWYDKKFEQHILDK